MSTIQGLWPIVARHIASRHVLDMSSLSKRSIAALVARAEEPSGGKLVAFKVVGGIQLVIVVLFVLAFSYTTERVFSNLAAVESDAPESYTQVSDEVTDEEAGDPKALLDEEPSQPAQPVTSGLLSTYRHLLSIGGKKSLFRGFSCFLVYALVGFPVEVLLRMIPFVPGVVSSIIASLLLVQLNTAWTHAIISKSSAKSYRSRLLPFRLVIRATALPTVIFSATAEVSGMTTKIFLTNTFKNATADSNPVADNITSLSLLLIFQLAFVFLVIIPAHAILVRVQTSLLPEEDRPIISLDPVFSLRKFEGKEYISTLEAFKSMTRASWRRLYMLNVKSFLLCILVFNVIGFLGFLEVTIARKFM